MILYRNPPINPFVVYDKDRRRYVADFRLYDPQEKKVIVTVGRGWFGSNNHIDRLELPDIKVLRKEKFDGQVFGMLAPKESFKDERELILYVPIGYFDFEITDDVEINHGGGYTRTLYRRYVSKKNPQVEFFERTGLRTDEETRAEAIALYKQIKELQERLDKIDPAHQAKYEVERESV